MAAKLFSWKNSYGVGNPVIDGQHRRIVGLVSDLYEAMSAGVDRAGLSRIFRHLIHYTVEHFRDEEAAMSRVGYPKLAEHVSMHCELTQTVLQIQKDMEAGGDPLTAETFHFLEMWLNDHLLGDDQEFAAFMAINSRK